MDSANIIDDPQDEVKKLQDLVRKLEEQNELLRTKQKLQVETLQNGEIEVDRLLKNHNNNLTSSGIFENEDFESNNDITIETLDDVDLIDIDNISLKDEEDSWLYASPKAPTPSQTRVSPYKWVRQEFDNPSPEVEAARMSLMNKLNEVARMSRSSSSPAFSSFTSPTKSSPSMTKSADSTPLRPNRNLPNPRQAITPTLGKRVDTGTFTRPRKGKALASTDDSDGSTPPPGVPDIEALAKMQEESLRQSIANTSPKRVEAPRRNSNSNSVGSDLSSPPDSPYGSQYLNPPTQESSSLRRSLTNVSRLTHSSGLHSSDSSLDHHSGGSEENNLAPETRSYPRLQPQIRPSSPNVSNLKQSTPGRRGLSPQRSGLPTPARRTIPRPGSASKLTPRRSGIPSPSPRPVLHDYEEDSWREGCF
ncbi:hypothetical protein ScPMuIL_010228 [Solemya velum]